MAASLKQLIVRSCQSLPLTLIKIKEPSSDFIKLLSKHVRLERQRNYSAPHPKVPEQDLSNFIFFLRILDFHRWEFRRNWHYRGKKRFWALVARLEELFRQGDLHSVSAATFRRLISPQEPDSLARRRYQFFRSHLVWLNHHYQGDFRNYFTSHQTARSFVLGLKHLPRFSDFITQPKRIYFLKPGQALFIEYVTMTEQTSHYRQQLADLTALADYRVPQILMDKEILMPNDRLARALQNQTILRAGARPEIEIRLATILACEQLAQRLRVPTFEIDEALWHLTYQQPPKTPHMRVRSLYY